MAYGDPWGVLGSCMSHEGLTALFMITLSIIVVKQNNGNGFYTLTLNSITYYKLIKAQTTK